MSLADRVSEVRSWAASRIRTCQEQETKFGLAWRTGETQGKSTIPQALVEAWQERRTLEAVLRMLDDGDDNDDPQSKALALRPDQECR